MELCLQLLATMQQQILGRGDADAKRICSHLLVAPFRVPRAMSQQAGRQIYFSRAHQHNSIIVLRTDNTTDVIQLAIFFLCYCFFYPFSGDFPFSLDCGCCFLLDGPSVGSSLFIFEASSRRFQQSVPTLRGVPPTRETLENRQHKVVSFFLHYRILPFFLAHPLAVIFRVHDRAQRNSFRAP